MSSLVILAALVFEISCRKTRQTDRHTNAADHPTHLTATGVGNYAQSHQSMPSHLESSLGVSVSLGVVSNSSLFSRMKFRCMRAICAMMRSRRFAANSIFLRFSRSSLPSTLLPRCRRLDGVTTVPSPSAFCSPPISSSNCSSHAPHTHLVRWRLARSKSRFFKENRTESI